MYYIEPLTNLYDRLHHFWEHPKTQRFLTTALVFIFIFGFLGIQCKRWEMLEWVPAPLYGLIPTNHFQAVSLAFTMLLFLEVMSLIFVLSCSMSRAIGKQLEILALILLRNAFKELMNLHEPVNFALDHEVLPRIIACSVGALLVFICYGVYRRMPRIHNSMAAADVMGYVMSKKVISLGLLISVVCIGGNACLQMLKTGQLSSIFFEHVYTTLIFADILLVLVSQRYMPQFQAIFRNSGYVIATLLMRLSFAAPAFIDVGIGVIAAGYVLAITWAVHRFQPARFEKN